MKITDLKIGDCVCSPRDKFPMTVVGLYSTLEELAQGKGTVYLDFEGNEGEVVANARSAYKDWKEEKLWERTGTMHDFTRC